MTVDFAGKRRFVLVLGCLSGIAAVSIDMSLPSIPGMVDGLATSMSSGQQIVGVFVAGIALGQLPAGLISDRVGRIPVLVGGIGLFTLAGIGTSVAPGMEPMLLARFLQGLGASVGVVVSRAIVRDIASGREAARLLSVLVMIFTAAPMLAPVIGSYLVSAFGWRAPFVAITVFGAVILLTIGSTLHETRHPNREHHFLRQMLLSFREFFRHRQSVLGLTLVVLPAMGFMSLITGSSALIVEIYGYPVTQFGLIFALAGVSILTGSFINRQLLVRYNAMQMAGLGALLIGAAAVQLLLMAWLGAAAFWWVWGSVCLYMFGVSFLLTNATAIALDPVPTIAGAAASIIGTLQNLAASSSAMLSGIIYDGTMPRAVLIMGIFGVLTCAAYLSRGLILGGQPLHVPTD